MKRRDILKGTILGAAAVSAGLARPALAQNVKELRMVTSWPKNFPGLGTGAERLAQRIQAATDGRYRVRYFAAGELVGGLKCHDAVQEGTADLYHSADYYYLGKSKAYAFFATVPFGMTGQEHNAWIHHGGGQQLWDELGREFGMKHLAAGNTGIQLAWFKKPITSADDFKGLKMRIPGLGGDVVKALGGTPVTLAGPEILPALEAGTVDAAEWVGPWNDLAFGFHKVLKNYGYPGFHEPGPANSFAIRSTVWDAMTPGDQIIFEALAAETNEHIRAEFDANNGRALDTLVNKHGVKLFELPDDAFRAIGAAAEDVLASAGASDALTRRVYESYTSFRNTVAAWSKISEQAYLNKRSLTLA